jgi:hypothetical protein
VTFDQLEAGLQTARRVKAEAVIRREQALARRDEALARRDEAAAESHAIGARTDASIVRISESLESRINLAIEAARRGCHRSRAKEQRAREGASDGPKRGESRGTGDLQTAGA